MTRQTFVPDLDDYVAVPLPEGHRGGCEGCVFRTMSDVRCSAIPCIPHLGRRWPVIYRERT